MFLTKIGSHKQKIGSMAKAKIKLLKKITGWGNITPPQLE